METKEIEICRYCNKEIGKKEPCCKKFNDMTNMVGACSKCGEMTSLYDPCCGTSILFEGSYISESDYYD